MEDDMQNIEAQLEARQSRRMASEDRFLAREDRRWSKAEPMIGELCKEGRTVYYVYPVGGKYKEAATRSELVAYLIRNRYVW
jgi:hypothetical protein